MRKVGHPNFWDNNKEFNKRAKLLVGKLFDTESCGPIGYIPPRRYLSYAATRTLGDRSKDIVHRDVVDQIPPGRYQTEDLGDYDKTIFAAIAAGQGNTYVLAGEMGSGKTATMNYMRTVLERKPLSPCTATCKVCDPVVVFISLDAGTQYTSDLANPVAAFRDDLITTLQSRLYDIFVKEQLTDRFILFARNAHEQRYQRFAGFQTALSMWQLEKEKLFSSLPEELKCAFLMNWIQNADTPELRLDLLAALGAYVKNEVRHSASCFTLLVDNIDRHIAPAQQMAILRLLFGLQETGIRVLVAMRQTTFAGLGSIAAFSFQYIPHNGPDPLVIGAARIRHALERFDEFVGEVPLESDEKNYLQRRLEAILSMLEVREFPRGRLSAFSGASVRAGLTILNRLVLNSSMSCNVGAPSHKIDWLRAAVLGDTTEQHFDPTDRYIVNLFGGALSGKFSWVGVRILQLIEALFGTPVARNAKSLCTLINIILQREANDELLSTFNYLLQPTHPLLWVEGVYSYSSYDVLLALNDVFNLTSAGHKYWKNLLTDSVYLQEALVGSSWSNAALPAEVSYKTASERSEGMRAIIGVFWQEDLAQHRLLLDTARRTDYLAAIRGIPPVSMIAGARLASGAIESMKNSVNSVAIAYDLLTEATAWNEVLFTMQREAETMQLQSPKPLNAAIRDAESAIRLANGIMKHHA